jgi:hypothetical protein
LEKTSSAEATSSPLNPGAGNGIDNARIMRPKVSAGFMESLLGSRLYRKSKAITILD